MSAEPGAMLDLTLAAQAGRPKMWGFTVRQPHASLIACGEKWIETRSRRPRAGVRGSRVFIHAGKHRPPAGTEVAGWTVNHMPHGDTLYWHDCRTGEDDMWHPLHYGAIVATAVLATAVPMLTKPPADTQLALKAGGWLLLPVVEGESTWLVLPSGQPENVSHQVPLGNFAPGRWAWVLDDIRPLQNPILCAGSLAWFQHDVPEVRQ